MSSPSADSVPVLKKCLFAGPRGTALPYRLYAPRPKPRKPVPLILFLHGAGERGSDNEAQLRHGVYPLLRQAAGRGIDLYLAAPQCPAEQKWVDIDWFLQSHTMPPRPSGPMAAVLGMLEKLMREEPVDPDRIYITGLSMGGFGTWDLLQRQPALFAAALPVCGGGDARLAARFRHVPLWAFHGALDETVRPLRSRAMVAALQKAGGRPGYTEYPHFGHNSWVPAYGDPLVFDWLLNQRRPAAAQRGKQS